MARPPVRRQPFLAWVGMAILVGVLICWPLARLVAVLVSDRTSVGHAVTSPGFGLAVAHSIETAFGTTILAVPGGALLALVTARAALPARRALQAVIVLPLLVPPFVLGYSWTQAYGPFGLSDHWFGVTIPGLFGPAGIIVVGAATSLPISYFVVGASLATRNEPDLERAARVLGGNSLTTLRTVTIPLLRAPLGAASALVFVAAVEGFAIPAALGTPANYDTMTTRIYSDLALASEPSSFTQAIALSLGLVVLAGCMIWPADRLFRAKRHVVRSGFAAPIGLARRATADRVCALLIWCYVAIVVVMPLAAVLLAALTPAVGVSPIPANWTSANFRQAFTGPTAGALEHSVVLAAVSAILLVAMGLLVAILEGRTTRAGLGTMVTLGYALPGSALAVGVMLAFGRYIGGTLAVILLAYLAKLWPLAHRPISAALDRLDPDQARAARVNGATLATAWRTVILPRLGPALCGAGLLVALTVAHELTISSLLYGRSSETLAVVVLNAQQLGDIGVTAALSVVMTVLVVVFATPALAWFGFHRRRARVSQPARAAAVTELVDAA